MTVQEIRDACVESAEKYYEFLETNRRGFSEINVNEIQPQSGRSLFKIRIASRLFDPEAVFFKIRNADHKYASDEIKIVEYDSDKNILIIKPSPEILPLFQNLSPRELKVISDMKFLVKRVESWYRLNGMRIAIPTKPSVLKDSFKDIKYLEGFTPSANQKASLKNIFENPFSYIWGAPGTGKTQFVLAYSILHYINSGKRVAIIAPTNNSIEQVLLGVLKMVDAAGIDRKKFLRLGTPSRKFAEAYPEICEERGVQKQLDELSKQIELLERMLNHDIFKKLFLNLKLQLNLFDAIDKKVEIFNKLTLEIERFRKTEARARVELKETKSAIEIVENDIDRLITHS
ncbi:MAG TPA: AAA domain-containing protein, partial [Bacteroidia bacterium]|nr:AAA domain-containing protein [Bacteroidia bacterium]